MRPNGALLASAASLAAVLVVAFAAGSPAAGRSAAGGSAPAGRESAAPAAAIRIGTFHTPSLVLAYHPSKIGNAVVQAKRAEQEKARAAGDTKKVDELENWGRKHQDRAHRQLAGTATVDDVLEPLKAAFPEVAKAAGVDAIVGSVLHAGPGVEIVDVTDALLERFGPTDKVRARIREMRTKSPEDLRAFAEEDEH